MLSFTEVKYCRLLCKKKKHGKFCTYIDFTKDAQGWRPSGPETMDEIGRDPGVEELRSAAIQFLQGHAAVQTLEQRTNKASAPGMRVHG